MPIAPRWLLIGTGVLLGLGGCSGTPFGDQLARSFSSPDAPAAGTQPPRAGTPGAPAPPTALSPNQPAIAPKPLVAPDAKTPAGSKSKPASKAIPVVNTLQPVPYRVTIKLPEADPSAPAEVVTQALRAAGVNFEVEMIERVRGNGGTTPPAAPVVTPAQPPR